MIPVAIPTGGGQCAAVVHVHRAIRVACNWTHAIPFSLEVAGPRIHKGRFTGVKGDVAGFPNGCASRAVTRGPPEPTTGVVVGVTVRPGDVGLLDRVRTKGFLGGLLHHDVVEPPVVRVGRSFWIERGQVSAIVVSSPLGLAKIVVDFVVDPVVIAPDFIDVPSFPGVVFLEYDVVCGAGHGVLALGDVETCTAFGLVQAGWVSCIAAEVLNAFSAALEGGPRLVVPQSPVVIDGDQFQITVLNLSHRSST